MNYAVTNTQIDFPQGRWAHWKAMQAFSKCQSAANAQRLMSTTPAAQALNTTFHYSHTVQGTPFQSVMHAPMVNGWMTQPVRWVQQHTAPIVEYVQPVIREYVQPVTRYVTEEVVQPAVQNARRNCRKWVFIL